MVFSCVLYCFLTIYREEYVNMKTLKKVINEGIWNAIKNYADRMGEGDRYKEGKPNTIDEVITGNGWKIHKVLEKTPQRAVIAVCVNRPLWREDALEYEELIDDLNVYFKDRGLNTVASALDNSEYGYDGYGLLILMEK